MILPHMCEDWLYTKGQVHQMTLWGHQVQIVHACHTYVRCALYKVLGISPTRTKFLKQYYFFFNLTP